MRDANYARYTDCMYTLSFVFVPFVFVCVCLWRLYFADTPYGMQKYKTWVIFTVPSKKQKYTHTHTYIDRRMPVQNAFKWLQRH